MQITGVTLAGTYVVDHPVPVTNGIKQWFDIGSASSYPGSGTTLTDLSGSGLGNGALAAPVSYTSAGVSSYVSFNGSNTYAQTANIYSMVSGTLNVTIECWIRTSVDNGVIISEQGTAPFNSGWHDAQMEIVAGNYKADEWTGAGYGTAINAGAVSRNVWQQYVMTYNLGTTTLTAYINGVSKGTSSMTRVFGGTVLYYAIAYGDFTNLGDGSFLACDWSILRVYNRALSAAEVLQNYQADSWRYS